MPPLPLYHLLAVVSTSHPNLLFLFLLLILITYSAFVKHWWCTPFGSSVLSIVTRVGIGVYISPSSSETTLATAAFQVISFPSSYLLRYAPSFLVSRFSFLVSSSFIYCFGLLLFCRKLSYQIHSRVIIQLGLERRLAYLYQPLRSCRGACMSPAIPLSLYLPFPPTPHPNSPPPLAPPLYFPLHLYFFLSCLVLF